PLTQDPIQLEQRELEDMNTRLRSGGLTNRERGETLRRRRRINEDRSSTFWRRKFNYRPKQVFDELINGKTSPRCTLPIETIDKEFTRRYSEDQGGRLPTYEDITAPEIISLRDPTAEDIIKALRKANANSSSGHDGISYKIWKQFPALGQWLHKIFLRCARDSRVPKAWQLS